MSEDLAGRAILVTGGGSGIGAATAQSLSDRGASVVICGRRAAPLRAVAERTGASWITADLGQDTEVQRLVGTAIQRSGRLDGVVANAGIMTTGSVLDTSIEDWDRAMAVNLRSVFLLARACLPHLIDSNGAFVSVSSIAGLRSPTAAAAYSTTKAALISLTRSIAVDFAGQGVRANVVCPGWVRTEMADLEMDTLTAPRPDRERGYRLVTSLVPQRRAAQPSEIADAIVWLCGPSSSYVNGAVITVDGGTSLVDAGTVAFDHEIGPGH
jgi:meso-butanediol dehydrogenase/(S,S)-butanediol dehydrogenase/diacetyl reductase